jgi:hypothetical protein
LATCVTSYKVTLLSPDSRKPLGTLTILAPDPTAPEATLELPPGSLAAKLLGPAGAGAGAGAALSVAALNGVTPGPPVVILPASIGEGPGKGAPAPAAPPPRAAAPYGALSGQYAAGADGGDALESPAAGKAWLVTCRPSAGGAAASLC